MEPLSKSCQTEKHLTVFKLIFSQYKDICAFSFHPLALCKVPGTLGCCHKFINGVNPYNQLNVLAAVTELFHAVVLLAQHSQQPFDQISSVNRAFY